MLSIKRITIVFLLSILFGFQAANAASFNEKLSDIRGEINRDNLEEAIKKLKKVIISNDSEQEKIDLLFGNIYLKINQINKAEEFYQKTFFTNSEETEVLTFIGLAEVRLAQGKLNDAINYAEQSIKINPNKIRSKIILAIAKTRLGENEEGFKILNELYLNRKDAEVALAISGYFSSFDETKKAIDILEEFIKRDPNNIKVLNQLASLHLLDGNKDKAIEYKLIVYKYYEFNRNRKKQKQAKAWILSVNPKYFDKPIRVRKNEKKEQEQYEEEEISNYDDNKVKPNYEEFAFAESAHGSGFIVGDGKYVITNYHVIDGARKIAVRNGIGKVTNAIVAATSEDFDLAILKLENPYLKKYSIQAKDFATPRAGEEVISIGYPGISEFHDKPTITQGIISKVIDQYGIFLTTAAVNQGNSGGPVFNLNGKLVGVSFASIDKAKVFKEQGVLPSDMGLAIKSDMIQEVFKHKRSIPIKSVKFNKASLYEKMLPSVVIVGVLLEDQ
jgi:S1-C subfamily serine protease/lipopolysaccharide biosynthesis regulator YciM